MFICRVPIFAMFYLTLFSLLVPLLYRYIQRYRCKLTFSRGKFYNIAAWLLGCTSIIMLIFVFHSVLRLPLDPYLDVEFAHVGLVQANSVRLYVRYPLLESQNGPMNISVNYWKIDDSSTSKISEAVMLEHGTDFTGFVNLRNLDANTTYLYQWKSEDGAVLKFNSCGRRFYKDTRWIGSYIAPRETSCDNQSQFSFRTACGSVDNCQFSFSFGSCMAPNFPYGQSLPGLDNMANYDLSFFLSLGDFIYADFPVFSSKSTDFFRSMYRHVFGQPDSAKLFAKTALIATIDDHEIQNNWDSSMDNERYLHAIDAFHSYIGTYSNSSTGAGLEFEFEYGPAAFFIMDSRTFRRNEAEDGSSVAYNDPAKTVTGYPQKQILFDWLLKVNQTHPFKIITSSVPFTFNFRNSDTWYGYQYERNEIAGFINKNGIENVIFLTGDRHQVGAVKLHFDDEKTPIHDFSVSPISQFFAPVKFYYFDAMEASKMTDKEKSDWNNMAITSSNPNVRWRWDETLFFTPYMGNYVFGKVDIDSTGKMAAEVGCSQGKKDVFLLCIIAHSPMSGAVYSGKIHDVCLNQNKGDTVIYSQAICA